MPDITFVGSDGVPVVRAVAPPLGSGFPPLPPTAVLLDGMDFEDGVVGQSYTSGQCEANNNQIVTDPVVGGGNGKVWYAHWEPGDAPVSGHAMRCEHSRNTAPAGQERIYRLRFMVPSGSWLPTPAGGWQQSFQWHGLQNGQAVTTTPFCLFMDAGATANTFVWRLGHWWKWDSAQRSLARDVWHDFQLRVRWATSGGWIELHMDNVAIPLLAGGTGGGPVATGPNGFPRKTENTLFDGNANQNSDAVYAKWGLDGDQLPGNVTQAKRYIALYQEYRY